MPDQAAAQATYMVVCAEFRTKPTNRAAAERQLAEVERLDACRYPHEIRSSDA